MSTNDTLKARASGPFSIQANVAQEAVGKVSRLFNASLDDIVNELLQNARRSGAHHVTFDQYGHPNMGHVIRIRDDGPGIDDPATLFSLGQSGWDAATCANEDAAGIGFFALAGRDVRVIAQQAGNNISWQLQATPEAFRGKAPITGNTGPIDHHGVEIIFTAEQGENIVSTATAAGKYCSIPVIVEGVAVPQEDFLEGACHVETWKGLRIGIYRGHARGLLHKPNLNFHGLTLRTSLPSLSQVYHDTLDVRIDVVNCADLKLVLPARKEIVRDAFHSTLWHKIEEIYYRCVARQDVHSLAFKNFQAAKAHGITLPEAMAQLRPFSPAHADSESTDWFGPEAVQADALLCEGADDAADEQNLAWALSRDAAAVRLYEPNTAFEGYDWYDVIGTIAITGYVCQIGPRRLQSEAGVIPDILERPDRLFVTGRVMQDGAEIDWQVETDLILFADAHASSVDETILCLTGAATVTAPDLVDLMIRAIFCPSQDFDAGSYDSQLQWFTDEAEDTAIAYLEDADAVHRNQVERVIRRELYWILRPTAQITVEIVGSQIEIHGLETAFQTKAVA